MFQNLVSDNATIYDKIDTAKMSATPHKAYNAIKEHGIYTENKTNEWRILNMADMQVDYTGKEIDVISRLDGIKYRYGEDSNQYLMACDICYQVRLTPTNLAKLIN